jgi:hypothetical protein
MACDYGNREIFGIIADAGTGEPVVGARIRIGAIDGQCVPGTPDQRTGARGFYSTMIAGARHGDGRYVFQVTAEGYESCTGEPLEFPHPHGDNVHRSFTLQPR